MNDKDEYGQTPIYYSCRDNKPDTVKYLITKGADVNSVDMHGQSSLFYAAKTGRLEICEILIDAGADIHLLDNKKL